jgi:hypothetical protein
LQYYEKGPITFFRNYLFGGILGEFPGILDQNLEVLGNFFLSQVGNPGYYWSVFTVLRRQGRSRNERHNFFSRSRSQIKMNKILNFTLLKPREESRGRNRIIFCSHVRSRIFLVEPYLFGGAGSVTESIGSGSVSLCFMKYGIADPHRLQEGRAMQLRLLIKWTLDDNDSLIK